MPTARELLQEIDALMRRNRSPAHGGEAANGGASGSSVEQAAAPPATESTLQEDHAGPVDPGPPTEALAIRPVDSSSVPSIPAERPRPATGEPSRWDAIADETAGASDLDGIPVLTDRASAVPAEIDHALPTLSAAVPDDLPVLTEAVEPDLAARWAEAQAPEQNAVDASIPADSGEPTVGDEASWPAAGEHAGGVDAGSATTSSESDAMLAEAAAQVPLASGIAAIDPTALDGFLGAYETSAPLPAAHETVPVAVSLPRAAREGDEVDSRPEDEIAVETALAASAHAAAMSFGPQGLDGDFAVGLHRNDDVSAADGAIPSYSQADAEAEIEALIAAEALAAESAVAQAARMLPPLPPRAVVHMDQPVTASVPVPSAAADEARWSAMVEEIRMQVLQRVDLFTESGLTAQLAQKLQPVVAEASVQLVATINREVGALLRAYIAETIEREIEQLRHKGEP